MKIINLLCLFAILTSVALAGTHSGPKFSDDAEKEAMKRREQIREEISALDHHAWAGEYYYGDGLGTNVSLSIAPRSGFVFEWHGCLGLYDRNYGSVTLTNETIRLLFTFDNRSKGFEGIAEQLLPVSWVSREYLIPSHDMIGFCNEVNEGSEPRENEHGNYLLRVGDEEKKASGFPSVPDEYRPYLLTRPIEAKIIAVGTSTSRPFVSEYMLKEIPVKVNAGKAQGLLPGMKLHVVEPGFFVEAIVITKIGDKTSEGVMTQIDGKATGPKVGWKLSTQSRWNPWGMPRTQQADTANKK
jgi:hypothetical protein